MYKADSASTAEAVIKAGRTLAERVGASFVINGIRDLLTVQQTATHDMKQSHAAQGREPRPNAWAKNTVPCLEAHSLHSKAHQTKPSGIVTVKMNPQLTNNKCVDKTQQTIEGIKHSDGKHTI